MIIKTSAKHAMLLQVPPVGRYVIELKKVTEEQNKKKDGTNVVYFFEIAEGDFTGKPFRVYCSMNHDIGVATALQIHQAITGDDSTETEFDPEKEIGGKCVGEIEHEMYNGNKQATLKGFLPEYTPTGTPF